MSNETNEINNTNEIILPHKYSPRDYQIPFLKAWDSGYKRLFIVWHRRCLEENTLIAMSNGTYKKIKDVLIGDSVLSYLDGKLVDKKVLEVFDNGIKKVSFYNNLIATENHEILIDTEKNKYEEIEKAKHMVYAGELSFGTYHNPELAEILGLLLTDGCVTINQTPKFTNIDEDLLSRFEYLMSKQFPDIITKRYKKGKGYDITCATKVKTNFHPLRKFFETSNTLPEIVWTFDKESMLAFLSGVISGDGSISYRNTKTPRGFYALTGSMVIEAGISYELSVEYQKILLKFGIHAKLKKDPRGNNNRVYSYSLRELHFLNGIDIKSKHKQERLNFILDNVNKLNNIRRVKKTSPPTHTEAKTFDLTIEDTSNYIANGYIVHNSGKDKTVFANLSKKMMERVGTYFYFLPTYSQSKKVIWNGADGAGFRFLDHFPKEIVKDINQTEMKIELKNGSILQMVGADNIDRIVGTNPIGVVFSEYSIMKPEVWDFIRPILAENGGWAVFVMTPRGTNHAWVMMQKALDNPKEWFVQVIGADVTSAIKPEALEMERKEMPQDLFEQEYMCRFIEGASGFFKRIDENTYKTDEYQPKELAMYQIGVDLAKYNDFTVITPFNLNDFHVGKQERFNQMDYNLQKAKIENTYLRLNKGRIIIDSTGVGEPVYDDLYARGMNIEPFRFNRSSRKDLLKNLQIQLEQDRIKIPNDPILITELKSMQYTLNETTGTTSIQVPSGMHDDTIMSLALSVWGIPQNKIHVNQFTRSFQTGGVEPFYDDFGY